MSGARNSPSGGSGIYRMGEENGLISKGKSLCNPRICTLFTRYTSPRGSQELVPTPGVEGRKNLRDEYLVDESSSQPNILWSPEGAFKNSMPKFKTNLKPQCVDAKTYIGWHIRVRGSRGSIKVFRGSATRGRVTRLFPGPCGDSRGVKAFKPTPIGVAFGTKSHINY